MNNYKIIVVNLKNREDRKNNVINLFKKYGINNYTFFDAVNGYEIDLTLEIKNLFEGNDFGNRRGFIGCALSHYEIMLNLTREKEIKYYIIFEDDIDFVNNFNKFLINIQKFVCEHFKAIDFLFLGYHKTENDTDLDINNIQITTFDIDKYMGGTYAYIMTKRGAHNFIKYIHENGIKHGIDYLFKINNNLKIAVIEPNIVISDWVKSYGSPVDSDIQKDFSSFDFSKVFDYHNYHFYKGYDIVKNDIDFIKSINVNELIKKTNDYDDIALGFNTIGFIKSNADIVVNEKNEDLLLTKSSWYPSDNDGIYLKMNKKMRVKIICDWISSKKLCNDWSIYSQGNGIWNNIKMTYEDNNIDYYIIINKPHDNASFVPSKTIIFQMEPYCNDNDKNWGVKTWGIWAKPDPNQFLNVRTCKNYINNCTWSLNNTYEELMNNINITNKLDKISIVCSSKYYDEGHIKRIDFLKFNEKKGNNALPIDIYGNVNEIYNFKCHKGILQPCDKGFGIKPYKYYFIAENNIENNYITEKLWEPILCETLCFYYGAPNASQYINPLAFVQLDLNDYEASYQIMKESIENNLWEKRIDIIREEKYKILNYYNFFPTVERIITKDLWKNKIEKLRESYKIYILNGDINNKLWPFLQTMQEFGFDIEIVEKYDKNMINTRDIQNSYLKKLIYKDGENNIKYLLNSSVDMNYISYTWTIMKIMENAISHENKYNNILIIEDGFKFESYNSLLNHLEMVPNDYDTCILSKSNCKITNQFNSLYYSIKKYEFEIPLTNNIYSKKGIIKLLSYLSNIIPNNDKRLLYELYENNNENQIYTAKL